MDIINAYETMGPYAAAAALTGTTHKTVRPVIERQAAVAAPGRSAARRPRVTDGVREVIEARVKIKEADGRISAWQPGGLMILPRRLSRRSHARGRRHPTATQRAGG